MMEPPSQRPLFGFSDAHAHGEASFSPVVTSTAGPLHAWAPTTTKKRSPSHRQSMIPRAAERNGDSDGLLFITGTTLEDFRSVSNMTQVRKKAMGSYLKEKTPRDAAGEPIRAREDSAISNYGSEDQDGISCPEAPLLLDDDKQLNSSRSNTSDPHDGSLPLRDKRTSTSRAVPSAGSITFVLPSAPLVTPSRTDIPLTYDQTHPRPFQSIGKPLDPFRTMFQASHPKVSVEQLKFYCSRSFGTKAMGAHWIPTLVQSPHAFLSTLSIASAHYDALQGRNFESIQTLALRQEVIHLISRSLLDPATRADDFNVIALTQLIASELIAGEPMTLSYHERGVLALVQQRGGLEKLGVNGRLANTLAWVSLEAAIMREAPSHSIYLDYCASIPRKSYPNTATIPESPLFCPRGDFESLKRAEGCAPRMLSLLRDVRMLLDLFLHETKQRRQNAASLRNLHKKITQYPHIAEIRETKGGVLEVEDWRYEVVRLVSVLTATAVVHKVSLSEAVASIAVDSDSNSSFSTPTSASTWTSPWSTTQEAPNLFLSGSSPPPSQPCSALTALKTALENSNLSVCWSTTAGVLLWVALMAAAASNTNSDKKTARWFKALTVRVSIVLCFEHGEAIGSILVRMSALIHGLSDSAEEEAEKRKNRGKRRRVGGGGLTRK